MREIDLLKEFRNKTLEQIIEKFGKVAGELTEMNLSIWDAREILYEECLKIGKRLLEEDLK